MLPLIQRESPVLPALIFIMCWLFSLYVCAQDSDTLDLLIFDPVMLDSSTPDHQRALGIIPEQINLPSLTLAAEESNTASASINAARMIQDIDAYTKEISEIQRAEGPFAPELIQNLLILSDRYQQQNNHAQAIAVLERADHISRVNNGLYHSGQLPIIEGLIESYLAREDYEAINEKQRYLLFLNQKLQEKGSAGRAPSFAGMADYNMETFGQSLLVTPDPAIGSIFRAGGMDAPGAPEYARHFALDSLFLAMSNYSEAISTLINNSNFPHQARVQLEYKYLETIFLVGFSQELVFNPHYYLTSARISANLPNRWTYLRRNRKGYELGLKTFERILAYLDNAPSASDLERVNARIEFGDWHLLFGWNEAASKAYAQAWTLADELSLSPEIREEIFSPELPRQLPMFTAKPNSREKYSLSHDMPLKYSGYIDVSYYVNKNGTARRIRMLDKSDPLAFDVEHRLRRYLKNSPFRPHIVDGMKVDRKPVSMRYYYAFQ